MGEGDSVIFSYFKFNEKKNRNTTPHRDTMSAQ